MAEYIVAALIFGLTAGFKPGPLGLVVIQQTLEHGPRAGMRASMAPIFTDGPIVLAVFLLFERMGSVDRFAGVLSLVGGCYLLWMASRIVAIRAIDLGRPGEAPRSLSTAIKTNLLNPNPYLFWFSVGGSYIALGTTAQSLAFVTLAIGSLVLTKMGVVWMVARFREPLTGPPYRWVMRVLGVLMGVFGVLLLLQSHAILFT